MLKYGESGSEDEGGSVSRSDDEEDDEEEEEEEETQVLLNRPPKRPRQEDKLAQIGATLIPKVEGLSLSLSKDRFQSICNALGEMQAEHDRKAELLKEVCQLAVCAPSEFLDRIRKMMVDQARVEDSRKLREENARLNLEVGLHGHKRKQQRSGSGSSCTKQAKWWRRRSSSIRRSRSDRSHPEPG
jgi:hypothetical protein